MYQYPVCNTYCLLDLRKEDNDVGSSSSCFQSGDEDQRQSTKVYTQPVSLMLFFKCVQRLPFCVTYLTLSR